MIIHQGLGTSTSQEAKEYFSNMSRHLIPFKYVDQEDDESIDLAFSKKKVDDRKDWLRNLKPGTFLDHDTDAIRYQEFVNKELILFSMADNVRSIPSMVDGFKPGQRKVGQPFPLKFFIREVILVFRCCLLALSET